MDRLESVRVFMAVARLEGFSAAANELGISKAACSKHVARLETDLGVRLLNRSTRSVGLTEAGAAYRDRMREILADIEETESVIAQLNTEPRGQLRVMAPTSYGSFHLARAITITRRNFPMSVWISYWWTVRRIWCKRASTLPSMCVNSRTPIV